MIRSASDQLHHQQRLSNTSTKLYMPIEDDGLCQAARDTEHAQDTLSSPSFGRALLSFALT